MLRNTVRLLVANGDDLIRLLIGKTWNEEEEAAVAKAQEEHEEQEEEDDNDDEDDESSSDGSESDSSESDSDDEESGSSESDSDDEESDSDDEESCSNDEESVRSAHGSRSKRAASYLPPTCNPPTFNLPPLTSYLSAPTSYLSPPTSHLLPPTSHHLPPTSYPLPPTLAHSSQSKRARCSAEADGEAEEEGEAGSRGGRPKKKQVGTRDPPGTPIESSRLVAGMVVLGYWKEDKKWYIGRVCNRAGAQNYVRYADGDEDRDGEFCGRDWVLHEDQDTPVF